jgi:polyisoprenoid-binding protein YceI
MPRAPFKLFVCALASAALLAAPAAAEERTLTLDPQTTEVTFLLGATGHDVHGVLHLAEGTIRFDAVAKTAAGEVVIDARLAETGNKKRDKTMHNKVLESAAHPLLVFRPESIDGEIAASGRSEIELHGTVTLVGSEHPLAVPATIDIDGGRVSATAAFSVPFVEWGLHDPSTFLLKVAKQVEVSIDAHGSLGAAPATATAAVH